MNSNAPESTLSFKEFLKIQCKVMYEEAQTPDNMLEAGNFFGHHPPTPVEARIYWALSGKAEKFRREHPCEVPVLVTVSENS